MNKKFKLISILIAAILIAALVASCGGDKTNNTSGDKDNPIPDAGQNQGEVENTQEERILADLPEANFNGHVFKILTFGVQSSYEWEQVDLTAEEENSGDTINDAVWKRNQIVEEKFNIKIQEEHRYDGNFGTSLKKEIGAATGEFDLVSPRVIDSAGYMQSGYFMNLNNVPNIDLTKPWYDQGGVKEMSIDHKLFIVLTDALLSDDNATCITVFNKEIAKNYGLGDIYALVRENKWTVDKLYEFAKATAKDIDGDGKMTPTVDQYGYTCWGDAMVTFLHSGGQRLVSKDENDLPILAFNNPQTYNVMEKAMDLLYDKNVTGNVQAPEFKDIDFGDVFSSGKIAFGWCRMYMIPRLRAMETDFGILPIPKAYESIEGYPSTVNVHTSCALTIPVTTGDIDRATIIMESLSAESKYLLVPAYYDVSLKTKHSRDDESSEMLDLILSNRVLDIGDVYNFAEFGIEFYRRAVAYDRNLVSFYEKYESKVNKEIDKMMKKFDALD
jgi:ABC-type glycerol-3-phosphate transport system substrate-binding protein